MRFVKNDLTYEELTQKYTYDPNTGIFRNKKSKSKLNVGHIVEGHLFISINGKKYACARLAFLYMNGAFPENNMTHKNKIKTDNRWNNLKESTWKCIIECSFRKKSIKGVVTSKYNSFVVNYRRNGHVYNKSFKNFDDAVKKRYELEKKYSTCDCNNSQAFLYLKENNLI